MHHSKTPFIILLLTFIAGFPALAQPSPPGVPPAAHKVAAHKVAAPPTPSNLAYPQSLFVDSRNGNIWVADFDNNRIMRFDASSLTNVGEPPAPLTPEGYALGQNYPNPFNPGTTITFALRNTGHAAVRVYDLLGREVATLFDAVATAHTAYSLSFDATALPGGIYFYTLRSADGYEVRKMGVVK